MAGDNSHTILVVDDEKSILRAIQRLFRKEGYHLLTADCGAQGLELLKTADRDVALIISDQRMPEMNGARFLELSRDLFPDAVRFLLTGYSDMDAVVDAINRGKIHRYLTKPWDDQDLLLQVQQALKQYDLLVENRRLTELTRRQNEELSELNQGLEKQVEARTRQLHEQNKALQHANAKLEKSVLDVVHLLSALIENFNPQLGRNMKIVAEYSRKVAVKMTVESDTVEAVETAAKIHDIGLMGLFGEMLFKDEKEMTDAEYAAFRHHPVIAAVCIEHIDRLSGVAEIIMAHHERFDGRGYPAGISGADIPLGARIISVVSDYFRTLEAWPDSLAKMDLRAKRLVGDNRNNVMVDAGSDLKVDLQRTVIMNRAGSYYDPDIVYTFMQLLENPKGANGSQNQSLRRISVGEVKIGMTIVVEIRTRDGRLVLPAQSVINKITLTGLQRLAEGGAIEDAIYIDRGK